jgi:single-stranded-DNA-specific exonuclease
VTRWLPAPLPAAAADLLREGVSPRLAPLLARRGVADGAAAARFLTPSADQLHDPLLLAGMAGAVERLLAARRDGEKVAVVGDYDVDGVSATALLLAVFAACGLKALPIVPNRLREGYGFQPVHVERAAAEGCRLIVTVDCGTTAAAAVAAATAAGVDVIVTDHHLPAGGPPPGALVVNPRLDGCSYPFPDLAGVGLALKLALAFAVRAGRPLELSRLLRIACLGTIADLVPLTGENRVIAALGLAALADTSSPGLRALFARAGVRAPFSSADVAFRIGPRLNAAGRLADAEAALELLLTRDGVRAGVLADQLDRHNRERQAEETRVVEEARSHFAARSPLPAIVVAWREGWHKGVVGIAAGRIARELNRPAVLLSLEGETATGSGRSVPGIALHGFLARWEGRLTRFGGHAQAVGLTVEADRLPKLLREWEEAAGAEWPAELLTRRYEYELEVAPAEAGEELLAELARLEPHGQGNAQPLLRVGPLTLTGSPRAFGKGHLEAMARGDDGGSVALLGWRWGERKDELAGRFEVLAHLEEDRYRRRPVLRLIDCRPA